VEWRQAKKSVQGQVLVKHNISDCKLASWNETLYFRGNQQRYCRWWILL